MLLCLSGNRRTALRTSKNPLVCFSKTQSRVLRVGVTFQIGNQTAIRQHILLQATLGARQQFALISEQPQGLGLLLQVTKLVAEFNEIAFMQSGYVTDGRVGHLSLPIPQAS